MIRRGKGPLARRGRRRSRVAVTVGVAIAATVYSVAPASATPTETLAKKLAQAQKIEAKIEAGNERADVLDEQYLDAKVAATTAQRKMAIAARDLAAGQAHAADVRARLSDRAAALYVDAGNPDVLPIDTNSIVDLGARSQYGGAAADQDLALLNDVEVADQQLVALRTHLKHQQDAARARQVTLTRTLRKLKKSVAQQHKLLASVNTDIEGLIREIALQRIAEMELAAHAKLAKQLPNLPAPSADQSKVDPKIGADPGAYPAPSPGATAAVDFARQQLGDPYVYAADGPDSWDCSGLTMVAWAKGGVTMDHSAQDQFAMFTKVPLDQLQPGDLVFFGKPIHHVGIYVGAGTMIEAPHTGAFVRYSSIFRDDLVLQGARPGPITVKPLPA